MSAGLHDPRFEHDGCGVAFVASIEGEPSHAIVAQGVEALVNLGHRGASGSDPESGDGAGILVRPPHAFLRKVGPTDLPVDYGVGMTFLPVSDVDRADCRRIVAESCAEEGIALLGWRDVRSTPARSVTRRARPCHVSHSSSCPPTDCEATRSSVASTCCAG